MKKLPKAYQKPKMRTSKVKVISFYGRNPMGDIREASMGEYLLAGVVS